MHLRVHCRTIYNSQDTDKYPSTDARIKRMWYMYTCMQLIHKKNEIMPLAVTCMDLEMIILTEVSQRKTNTI